MDMLKGAAAAGVILAVLDVLWIGVVARGWITQQLGPLMREQIQFVPAILFYLLYAAGLGYFAVAPSLETGDWMRAAMSGVFLGLVAYGTYDLTNLATLKNWPLPMVIVDMIWGAGVSAASAAGGVLGDAKGGLQGRRVFSRLDGGDGLARHADLFSEVALRHLAMLEAQAAHLVGYGEPRHAQ